MKYLFLLLIFNSELAFSGMGSMNWNADSDFFSSESTFGILLICGFLMWVLISISKDNSGDLKPILFVIIGLPLIGIIIGFFLNGLGGLLKWLFSKDSIGVIFTIVFLYLVYRIFCKIGDDLIKEKEEEDNRKK